MKIIKAKPLTTTGAIAIVISRFNITITELLFQGAKLRLQELGIPEQLITVVWVPGAIEIPLVANKLAKSNQHFVAILCMGAVIRGETDHYDAVCQQVNYGCQRVALDNNIPIIFEVLMTETEELALARAGTGENNKGREAVDIAMDIISVNMQLGEW